MIKGQGVKAEERKVGIGWGRRKRRVCLREIFCVQN